MTLATDPERVLLRGRPVQDTVFEALSPLYIFDEGVYGPVGVAGTIAAYDGSVNTPFGLIDRPGAYIGIR